MMSELSVDSKSRHGRTLTLCMFLPFTSKRRRRMREINLIQECRGVLRKNIVVRKSLGTKRFWGIVAYHIWLSSSLTNVDELTSLSLYVKRVPQYV